MLMHISERWWACASISKVCLIQAAPAAIGRMEATLAEMVLATSRMRQYYFFFFFKANGFRETCLSFNMACLLLIWALKPCDRASERLSGEFVEEMLIMKDGKGKSRPCEVTVGGARALRGAGREAGSQDPFPEPSLGGQAGGRWVHHVGTSVLLGPATSFTLIGCDRSVLSPRTW